MVEKSDSIDEMKRYIPQPTSRSFFDRQVMIDNVPLIKLINNINVVIVMLTLTVLR